MGISGLNIGLESASDEALARFNKGFDSTQALTQISRLEAAGIGYSVNIIMGSMGAGNWAKSARINADFLNKLSPELIFTTTLHTDAGASLNDEIKSGKFALASLGDNINEAIELIRLLSVRDSTYFGLHGSNPVPISGRLPNEKLALMTALENAKEIYGSLALSFVPKRGKEGRILG